MWLVPVVFGLLIEFCCGYDLIVDLPDGKVQGTTFKSPNGREFYTWRGIPYAKPPLGDLRFQPPQRPDPWYHILDGSKDPKACMQFGKYRNIPVGKSGFSEDCLYVNVYSPIRPNSTAHLSVMVWIHGGGFIAGSGDFSYLDPTPLLDENVLVVTFNYRLGIFGFLSTEDQVLSGNAALKDQQAALVWTKENIAWFGGNPRNITIFGISTGAISVGYHLVSPLSRGLFNAAILQSGTCLVQYLQKDPRRNAIEVAKKLSPGVKDSSSSEDILGVMQSADAEVLVNVSTASGLQFKPVLEPPSLYSFMSQPFYESLKAGNFNRVPIIIGVTSEEQISVVRNLDKGLKIAKHHDHKPEILLPSSLKIQKNVAVSSVANKIKKFYTKNKNFLDDIGAFVRWLSEDAFVRPIVKHATLQSKFTPVYFYEFSFAGSRSRFNPVIPGCGKVGHNEDLAYLFNVSTTPIRTKDDFRTRKNLVKLWTNFAKTRNPTPVSDSHLQEVHWELFNENTSKYLDIGDKLRPKFYFRIESTAFWDYLWESYSYRPYNTF